MDLIKNSFIKTISCLRENRFSLILFSFLFTFFRTLFFLFSFIIFAGIDIKRSNYINYFLVFTSLFLVLLFFYKLIWNISIEDKENKIQTKLFSTFFIKISCFLGLFTLLTIIYNVFFGFHPIIYLILNMFSELFFFSILRSDSKKIYILIKNYFCLIKKNFLKIFLFELIFVFYNTIIFLIMRNIDLLPLLLYCVFSIFISPFRNAFSTQFYINIIEDNYDNNEINDI